MAFLHEHGVGSIGLVSKHNDQGAQSIFQHSGTIGREITPPTRRLWKPSLVYFGMMGVCKVFSKYRITAHGLQLPQKTPPPVPIPLGPSGNPPRWASQLLPRRSGSKSRSSQWNQEVPCSVEARPSAERCDPVRTLR